MAQRILRTAEVCKRLGGIHRATLRRMVARGIFPQPLQVSEGIGGLHGWRESDVDAFITSRPVLQGWGTVHKPPSEPEVAGS